MYSLYAFSRVLGVGVFSGSGLGEGVSGFSRRVVF